MRNTQRLQLPWLPSAGICDKACFEGYAAQKSAHEIRRANYRKARGRPLIESSSRPETGNPRRATKTSKSDCRRQETSGTFDSPAGTLIEEASLLKELRSIRVWVTRPMRRL